MKIKSFIRVLKTENKIFRCKEEALQDKDTQILTFFK